MPSDRGFDDAEHFRTAVLTALLLLAPREPEEFANHGLTKRERESLHRATRGETNAEIGEALGISGRTVAKHLEHAYAKLGVHGRREAARLA